MKFNILYFIPKIKQANTNAFFWSSAKRFHERYTSRVASAMRTDGYAPALGKRFWQSAEKRSVSRYVQRLHCQRVAELCSGVGSKASKTRKRLAAVRNVLGVSHSSRVQFFPERTGAAPVSLPALGATRSLIVHSAPKTGVYPVRLVFDPLSELEVSSALFACGSVCGSCVEAHWVRRFDQQSVRRTCASCACPGYPQLGTNIVSLH